MFEILVLINTAINLYLLYYVFWNRLEIRFRTSFFGKVPFGVDIWLWENKRDDIYRSNIAKSIIGFNFRNEDKIEDYPYIKTRYNTK